MKTGQEGKYQVDPEKTGSIDCNEVLSHEDFAVFARLREWRKEKAGEVGVPVYTIFTNEQLARIVTQAIDSKTGLRQIVGIGEARIKKYSDAVIYYSLTILSPDFTWPFLFTRHAKDKKNPVTRLCHRIFPLISLNR